MPIFFGIVMVVGLLWVLVEWMGKNSSPAPSQVATSGIGWLVFAVGVIGLLCTLPWS